MPVRHSSGRAESKQRVAPKTARPEPLTNHAIARQLLTLAQALQASGDNPFKVRAYRRAAETVAGSAESVADWAAAGRDLTRLPGVGKGIAATLQEIVSRGGQLAQLDHLMASAPPEVVATHAYPRLDPQKVARAFQKLGLKTADELAEALATGRLSPLGRDLEDHVRRALSDTNPLLLIDADALARRLVQHLIASREVPRVEVVGAVRRRVEVIEEIELLVDRAEWETAVARLARFGGGLPPVAVQPDRATFQLPESVLVTLHGGASGKWGLALILTTGAPAHLDKLESHTGPLSRWTRKGRPLKTEEEAYAQHGLAWIPPELREGREEVELAARGKLPQLVERSEIRGELHAHTVASDGANTIEQMVAAAKALGYRYLGVTDHSESLKIAGGLTVRRLRSQLEKIDRLNQTLSGFRILKSAEVDILADGRLDYPDEVLRELDYTICSIHSRFRLSGQEQTERLLRAMDHPAFTILGHATGRKLLRRPGYTFDFERVLAHARSRGCFFEINASPERLDLGVEQVRAAAASGVKIAVCTDAHHVRELDLMAGGVEVARRAGLSRADVLNTLPWSRLQKLLRRGR